MKTEDVQVRQYGFEESCLQAMYNATDPPDPFDRGRRSSWPGRQSAWHVVGVPVESVVAVLAQSHNLAMRPAPAMASGSLSDSDRRTADRIVLNPT